MSLILKQSSREFEITPEGVYVGRCYQIIDLGTQEFNKEGKIQHQKKIRITWELHGGAKMKDGRPFSLSQDYTASLSEMSNLYAHLIALRGKSFTDEEKESFNIGDILETYCSIQVIHSKPQSNGKIYANISSIMVTKEKPEKVNDSVRFDIDEPDMKIFEALPEWIQKKITAAPEWGKTMFDDEKGPDTPIDPSDIPL